MYSIEIIAVSVVPTPVGVNRGACFVMVGTNVVPTPVGVNRSRKLGT